MCASELQSSTNLETPEGYDQTPAADKTQFVSTAFAWEIDYTDCHEDPFFSPSCEAQDRALFVTDMDKKYGDQPETWEKGSLADAHNLLLLKPSATAIRDPSLPIKGKPIHP